MKNLIRYILKNSGWEQIGVLYGYLRKSGWFKSTHSKTAIDAEGEVIPWYSYPFIHFLNQRLNALAADGRELSLFEFGSGNSTLWWAKRAKRIVSVEDNQQWYSYVVRHKPSNVNYKIAADEAKYIGALTEDPGMFDIIIIDGSFRAACVNNAIGKLSVDGVLIIENSDWDSLVDSFKFLTAKGFRQLEFYGLGPVNGHPWGTSIVYRDHNVLKI